MPSPFEQLVSANLSSMYGQFGLSASYTAPDGTVTSDLSIRLQRGEVRQVDRPSGAVGEAQGSVVLVRQSDLAKPVRHGRFASDAGEVWTLEVTPVLKNGEWVCTCSRAGVERLMEKRAKE